MLFTIIVPTYNRPDFLQTCLTKLEPVCKNFGLENCELIVTEDGNNTITESLVQEQFSWAKWIKGPGRALSANRNNGIRAAKGEWIICIDDDCLADENILFEYQKYIQANPTVQAFEGCIEPDSWDLFKQDMAECPVNVRGGVFWGANICVKKETYKKLGGFDENFIAYGREDQDMFIRLKQITKVVFAATAKVIHPVRKGSFRKHLWNIPKAAKNNIKYEYKHATYFGYTNVFIFALKKYIYFTRITFKYLSQGRIKLATLAFARLLIYVPLNIIYFLKLSFTK